jgi:hypothetical protein
MQDHRGEDVVPVGEDVRFERNDIADHPFGWKTAVVDRRRDALDNDTTTSLDNRFRHELASCELRALSVICE